MRCYYCNCEMVKFRTDRKGTIAPSNGQTKDHLIPLHIRGKNAVVQQVFCCFNCNQDKGRLTLNEFRAVMMYRQGMISDDELIHVRFPGEK